MGSSLLPRVPSFHPALEDSGESRGRKERRGSDEPYPSPEWGSQPRQPEVGRRGFKQGEALRLWGFADWTVSNSTMELLPCT